ncbi:MAG: hypothetical protein A2161_04440 [Candidatus Schekmanbacteria bacterium RBG_13_48_7]|uniref:Uncharacterized protein n=1 Tax=Candidatus Schekmanbacteria bacterium RBG_13_48_7 TaxID=1817878 RepID=A0A1F7S5V4_9BACT|nr:MAG: hypothetical protein A2161_04440 [Candidatus Schekmanbacteria bacterium RBG_13_48_7]
MNDRKQKIEENVERTLQLFNEIETIEPGPYFYAKLLSKIKNLQKKTRFSMRNFFQTVVLRPAFLVFLVILNIFSASFMFQETENQSQIREKYKIEMASEFSLMSNSSNLFLTY